MILNANTIVNPRAVMIVSFYTAIANSTVFRAVGSDNTAIWAHFTRMNFFQ